MLLPVSVTDLWRWSTRSRPASLPSAKPVAAPAARPVLAVIPGGAMVPQCAVPKAAARSARQRLEEQFRQAYRDQQARAAAAPIVELASLAAGARAEIAKDINRPAEGRLP
jgi:hypothetical protein